MLFNHHLDSDLGSDAMDTGPEIDGGASTVPGPGGRWTGERGPEGTKLIPKTTSRLKTSVFFVLIRGSSMCRDLIRISFVSRQ